MGKDASVSAGSYPNGKVETERPTGRRVESRYETGTIFCAGKNIVFVFGYSANVGFGHHMALGDMKIGIVPSIRGAVRPCKNRDFFVIIPRFPGIVNMILYIHEIEWARFVIMSREHMQAANRTQKSHMVCVSFPSLLTLKASGRTSGSSRRDRDDETDGEL
jgi:hypothetical protein